MGSVGEGTVERYAGILRAVGRGGGDFRAYLALLCARGAHSSGLRAANGALQLCSDCGLFRDHSRRMELRMARAAAKYDLPAHRPYGAEGHFVTIARTVKCVRDLAILGIVILSFGFF